MQTYVHFPDDYSPGKVPIYTLNKLHIAADAETIWAWLIRAAEWPNWYDNCKNLQFLTGTSPDLEMGTVFRWKTFGVSVTTTVEEFEPPYRLAWRGKAFAGHGYHGWVIEPDAQGCLVITEEVQTGLLPFLGRFYLKPGLLREHQNWLEGLKKLAEKGSPS